VPVRVEVVREVGVPPGRLYEWWTDFREGDVDHRSFASRYNPDRRVRPLAPDRLVIEDTGRALWVPFFERYEVRLEPPTRVHLHGMNSLSLFRATYTFAAAGSPGRALVTLVADVAPLGLLALFDPLARPIVRRFLAKDLDHHLEDAVRDLA
jgi:hypothetical protein